MDKNFAEIKWCFLNTFTICKECIINGDDVFDGGETFEDYVWREFFENYIFLEINDEMIVELEKYYKEFVKCKGIL